MRFKQEKTRVEMKQIIKSAAVIAACAFATPVFAGGVTIANDGTSKLKLEGTVYVGTTDYRVEKSVAPAPLTQTTRTRSTSVDRAYLGVKYYFDDNWMMRITSDVNNEKGLGKSQQVFLKYAYLEGKLAGKAAVLRLGQSHTPWIDYEQGLWKHRYVSKVMSDQFGYDSSSELGIGLKGDIDMFHYWVTMTDGNSYSSAKTYKTAGTGEDLSVRLGVTPIEGLTIDLQLINGFNGTKTSTTAGTKQAFTQFMVTYGMGNDFRVGANYIADKKTTDATGLPVNKTDAVALWGWANFADNMGAFARLETQKDKLAVINGQKTNRYVLGLEYNPAKHINLSLAYDDAKVTNLAGVANDTQRTRRYGLFSQFTF